MTTIITGRDITLTIDSDVYAAQATAATLTNSPTITTYQTLDGKSFKHVDDQWTLDVELLADWGAGGSLFDAMWAAFTAAPNTPLAVSLVAVSGSTFSFNVFPVAPSAGGAAPDAQTDSWSMLVSDTPVLT